MKAKLVEMIFERFTEAISFIEGGMQVISGGMGSVSAVGEVVDTIKALILPMAYAILAILCIIDIIDVTTRKGEDMRWEDVVRILIKLVLCKTIMTMTPDLLAAMYNSATKLIDSTMGTLDATAIEGIKTGIKSAIRDDPTDGILASLWDRMIQIFQFISLWLMSWVATASGLIVYVLAYGRVFELLILQALSPLPAAFAGWGETKDIPKKFALSYFAVCLQGVAMVVCFRIFVAMISVGSLSFTTLLVFIIALTVGVVRSGNWAKEILGLG